MKQWPDVHAEQVKDIDKEERFYKLWNWVDKQVIALEQVKPVLEGQGIGALTALKSVQSCANDICNYGHPSSSYLEPLRKGRP